MYLLMKARSLSEFQAALSRQLIPRWNFLFSDDRNMFWVHNAVSLVGLAVTIGPNPCLAGLRQLTGDHFSLSATIPSY
jgi:hypothetical protein